MGVSYNDLFKKAQSGHYKQYNATSRKESYAAKKEREKFSQDLLQMLTYESNLMGVTISQSQLMLICRAVNEPRVYTSNKSVKVPPLDDFPTKTRVAYYTLCLYANTLLSGS